MNQTKWTAEFLPIRRLTEEEKKMLMTVHMGDQDWQLGKSCMVEGCEKSVVDTCYNCGRPICKEHDYPFLFLAIGSAFSAFGVCPECKQICEGILDERDDVEGKNG